MKISMIAMSLMLAASLPALAADRPDFSGTWNFNPDKSQNIRMMSQMKMTQAIHQSRATLEVISYTTFQGNDQQMKTHYDLTGKPATNDSPMEGLCETRSKWDGDKIVTTWTGQGAVAGTKTVRTETRWLSPDGKTMTVESVRGSNPAVVIVFEKK